MHHRLLSAVIPAVALSAATAAAIPLGTNITISDQNFRGTGWYSDREDNETETNPDTLQGQHWDLEGMFMDGTNLTLVGGYDFKNGVTYSNYNYRSGDIFIDLDGDAVFGNAANGGSGVGGTTTQLFGYDLVLDLDFTSMTFDVLELGAGTVLNRGRDVASSNPWRLQSGGSAVSGLQDLSFSYFSGLSNADVGGLLGYNGNNLHHAITLDTSFLDGAGATFHYTMECGNDNLMGQTSSVPDGGATALMLGAALVGMVGLRRRARRS